MKYQAKFKLGSVGKILVDSEFKTTRSNSKLKKEGKYYIYEINADDILALKAQVSSLLKSLEIYEKVENGRKSSTTPVN